VGKSCDTIFTAAAGTIVIVKLSLPMVPADGSTAKGGPRLHANY